MDDLSTLRLLIELGEAPKPTRCEKCGALRNDGLHYSNAAGAWVCLDCHLLADIQKNP